MPQSILVIDDNPDILGCFTEIFTMEGYSVLTAADGVRAMMSLMTASQLPDLIITDLRLPNMDGFEFRLRQLEIGAIAFIPLIFTSAFSINETSLLGCPILKKPFDMEVMISTVRSSLVRPPKRVERELRV
jgi:CheY-like chemotaxis protein